MSFRPMLIAPCLVEAKKAVFFLPQQEVEVELPLGFLRTLTRLCDGTRELESIVKTLNSKWDEHQSRSAIQGLIARGVLVESRNIAPHVWEFIKNPSPWNRPLTDQQVRQIILDQKHQLVSEPVTEERVVQSNSWTNLLERRSSHRLFADDDLPEGAVVRMIWSVYGQLRSVLDAEGSAVVHRRTIPSAGALYPLAVYLCAFRAIGSIRSGVYRISYDADRIRFHKIAADSSRVRDAFIQREVMAMAHGVLVVCGQFARTSRKYANRGMLYTALEAGHAVQNAHLSALRDGFATLEVGGFIENDLSKALKVHADHQPMICVAFGSKERSSQRRNRTVPVTVSSIVRELQSVPKAVGDYRLPFHMVFGKVISDAEAQTWWSCGRSKNLGLARTKALAEGIEWFASSRGHTHDVVVGTLRELGDRALDPRSMHPYLPSQLAATKHVVPFSPQAKHQWVSVTDIATGQERLVLADLVFYPFDPSSGRRYAHANSSGTAAHRTVNLATERALLELIERDAFMIAWLNRLKAPTIIQRSWPADIQRRVKALEEQGFNVRVVNLTFDLTPVPFVVAHHPKMPFLTCSAASDFDIVTALDRALTEVEGSVYCRIRDGRTRREMRPEDVWEVHDRNILYQQRDAIRRATFLLGDQRRSVSLNQIDRKQSPKSLDQLVAHLSSRGYHSFRADLSGTDPLLRDLPFTVVKAFVPGLVPLVFEYGLEIIGLERARMLPVWCGYWRRPIPTSCLNMYPHPYT